MIKISQFLVLSAILLMSSIASGANIPYLTGRVTDNAQILSPETNQAITDSLKAHEIRTSNQIAVLTIPSLNGDNIEDFAHAVFNEWKLGQKGKDNGILIVIAPNDRRMRIEVGYGLESVMTDIMANRIIQNVMTPKFKDGDYNGGIADGVSAVINVLNGEILPDTPGKESNLSGKSNFFNIEPPDMPITDRILFGCFIFGIIGLFTVVGICSPGAGWFLYPFLIPFWAMFPIVILGTKGALICLITYLIGFPLAKLYLKNTNWYKKAKDNLQTKGSTSIGGFTFSGGSSGGSWSSGGSSSFSGGGGSSGGGGASGSW